MVELINGECKMIFMFFALGLISLNAQAATPIPCLDVTKNLMEYYGVPLSHQVNTKYVNRSYGLYQGEQKVPIYHISESSEEPGGAYFTTKMEGQKFVVQFAENQYRLQTLTFEFLPDGYCSFESAILIEEQRSVPESSMPVTGRRLLTRKDCESKVRKIAQKDQDHKVCLIVISPTHESKLRHTPASPKGRSARIIHPSLRADS